MSEPPSPSRWDADAETYDRWFDQPWGAYATTVEHDLLLASVPVLSGTTVCDAGCGTDRLTARLEAEGAQVTGVDFDRASLVVARRRVTGSLVEGDVHRLPFADATFDTTFAVTVCAFLADPAGPVVELVRVTRPGGHLVIGSLNPHSAWGWWNRRQLRRPPWGARDSSTRRRSNHSPTTMAPSPGTARPSPSVAQSPI